MVKLKKYLIIYTILILYTDEGILIVLYIVMNTHPDSHQLIQQCSFLLFGAFGKRTGATSDPRERASVRADLALARLALLRDTHGPPVLLQPGDPLQNNTSLIFKLFL